MSRPCGSLGKDGKKCGKPCPEGKFVCVECSRKLDGYKTAERNRRKMFETSSKRDSSNFRQPEFVKKKRTNRCKSSDCNNHAPIDAYCEQCVAIGVDMED